MLGYLLARAGVQVTVLEKHNDFFRDFRGDTVHPSTLELFHELGLLEEFLKLPHQKITSAGGIFGGYPFEAASFRHVPARCKFVALIPQWDFLDFLVGQARKHASFDLRLGHEAVGIVEHGGRVIGVDVRTPGEDLRIGAGLVVGCDGRHSTIRKAAGLQVREFGVPMDVLWFRVGRHPGDSGQVFGNINYGKALILINRGDYFQAGMIVQKGAFDAVKRRGMGEFRAEIARIAPFLDDRVDQLRDWDQVKLLTVQLNRLRQWYRPGLLCIGDAAHAMSPAGGVGINLAIQDAVAAARLLATPLREGLPTERALARIQQRREFPTKVTQFLQMYAHKGLARIFQNPGPAKAPWQLKVAVSIPGVRRLLGRAIGIGVRPEHIAGARGESGGRGRSRPMPLYLGIGVAVGVFAARLVTTARSRKSAKVAGTVMRPA
jgi:2-polyprenyl-6-methoxyphenol hydroxylase-like FAD-dependent oxidoreductase